ENEIQACIEQQQERIEVIREIVTNKIIDAKLSEIYKSYETSCLGNVKENLKYTSANKEYHYTLYYYDQSGNLVQTVPPKGVNKLTNQEVTDFVQNGVIKEPAHELKTRYKYNSLGQLIWQDSPDGGIVEFLYDRKSQLRLSQDAEQRKHNEYSYTKYDPLGRPVEVGEYQDTRTIDQITQDEIDSPQFPEAIVYEIKDVMKTYYDHPATDFTTDFEQENLRSRVSYTTIRDTETSDPVTTLYSYDPHGNVQSILKNIPGLGAKRTDYDYDLISGNVHHVIYQYGQPDQFYHRYNYDADNRIHKVLTSVDGFIWNKEAEYFYYPHGPLARVELGEYNVQGLDYYYNLQGWIKGVNMPGGGADPGNDGVESGRDEMAFSIGYFEGDYEPIGQVVVPGIDDQLWDRYNDFKGTDGLFNGNIGWMSTELPETGRKKGDQAKGYQAMLYDYDQLNRIVSANSLTKYNESGFGERQAGNNPYDAKYSYDPNGNLLTLTRNDGQSNLQDEYDYVYEPGTNKLLNVVGDYAALPLGKKVYDTDPVAADGKVYKEILLENGASLLTGNATVTATEKIVFKRGVKINNSDFEAVLDPEAKNGADEGEGIYQYEYDAIGNLVRDNAENLTIDWTAYGKVSSITKDNGDVTAFKYDPEGNRIEKKVAVGGNAVTTHYLRDASGNVMATYKDTELIEQPIYGSDRLGLYLGKSAISELQLGNRQYELKNHLSNVLAVVTDNIEVKNGESTARVVSNSDYYPFGMHMPDRSVNTEAYRYGFNGKEKDDKGEWGSTHYDYGFRIYNPAIAKFLSVDPLTDSYPWYTPYQFAGNTPINSVDLDGLEEKEVNLELFFAGKNKSNLYDALIIDEAGRKLLRYYLMKKYFITEKIIDGRTEWRFDGKRALNVILEEGKGKYNNVTHRRALYKLAAMRVLSLNDDVFEKQQYRSYLRERRERAKNAEEMRQFKIRLAQETEQWKKDHSLFGFGSYVSYTGTGMQVVGFIALIVPGGQAVGLALIEVGGYISLAGSTIEVLHGVEMGGDLSTAGVELSVIASSKVAGNKIIKAFKHGKISKEVTAILGISESVGSEILQGKVSEDEDGEDN
ncbi:MAG: RHS repeat-associated core domain-containing protein, partial [Bacteroidota bacterium]